MLAGKTLLDYTNLFSRNDYKKNNKIKHKYFRLKEIDETRNYLLEEINQNCLMSEKHKQVSTSLNDFEHFLVFISAVSGCVAIFAFASLVGVLAGVTSSAVGINICASTAGIRNYMSIIKKKRKT